MLNDSVIEGSKIAAKRVPLIAREQARLHGTKLAIWEDGKVVWLTPEELDRRDAERSQRSNEGV